MALSKEGKAVLKAIIRALKSLTGMLELIVKGESDRI